MLRKTFRIAKTYSPILSVLTSKTISLLNHLSWNEIPVVQHSRWDDAGVPDVAGVAVVLTRELTESGSAQRRSDLLRAVCGRRRKFIVVNTNGGSETLRDFITVKQIGTVAVLFKIFEPANSVAYKFLSKFS